MVLVLILVEPSSPTRCFRHVRHAADYSTLHEDLYLVDMW